MLRGRRHENKWPLTIVYISYPWQMSKNASFNECCIFEREQENRFYIIHMNIFIWGHNIVFPFLWLVFEWGIEVDGKIIFKVWVTWFESLDLCVRPILSCLIRGVNRWPQSSGCLPLSLRYSLYVGQLISCPAAPPDELLLPIISVSNDTFVLSYKSLDL